MGVLGAARECRYSGFRRGIGSIRGYWRSPRGEGGVRRPLGSQDASEDVRGVLWGWQGIGSIRGHWSLLGM